jgi:hypothetical protein
MSKESRKRTEKSKYKSLYSGSYVTAAQYFTELICGRIAKKKKKELPDKFWNDSSWAKEFRSQVGAANRLLKKYDSKAIFNALNNKVGKGVFSLRPKFFQEMVAEEQIKIDVQKQKQDGVKIERKDVTSTPRQRRPSKIDKLMELDNE